MEARHPRRGPGARVAAQVCGDARGFGRLPDRAFARSRYRAVTGSWLNCRGLYPGSAVLAMTVLGDAASYLLCDLDPSSAADLRLATTPGTGFGMILANVQAGTVSACAAVGSALADAYADALLPDGSRADLAFTTSTNSLQ